MRFRGQYLLLVCCLLFSLTTNVFATKKTPGLTPWLVSITLDEQALAGVYHCYANTQGQLWLPENETKQLHFPAYRAEAIVYRGKRLVRLADYPGLQVRLDPNNLVLVLHSPAEWASATVVTPEPHLNGRIRPETPGLFLNYDVTNRQVDLNGLNYSASLGEVGYFNRFGVGTSSFLFNGYNYYTNQYAMSRLDTRWTMDEPEKIASLRLGDSISSGLDWTGAVRFAGIQYATNFNTQPSLVTFPQPQVRGEAALPSVVNVYVNNTLGVQQPINRGAFLLNQVPVVTGAGNLEVVTTDLLGRQQVSVIPYYASPILLKSGLENFSWEAGVIRNNYGLEDYNYGRVMASGTYSKGITNRYTAGTHVELLGKQQTLGFSHNYLLGLWGTVSLGYAGSYSRDGIGGLLSLGFHHNTPVYSYGAIATFASHDYKQLGTLYSDTYPPATIQSYAGINLGSMGSLMVTYTALNNAYNENKTIWYNYLFPASKIVSISYSRSIYKKLFLNAGAFIDAANGNNNQLFITLSMPFDNDKLLSTTHQSQSVYHQNGLQLTKNLPFGEGYGYQLQLVDNKNYPTQANIIIQRSVGVFSARYANLNQENNYEINARGSFISFAGHQFPARYVEQSFALVEVPTFAGVEVYSRNQLIGKTNKAGYLYIPDTLPYQLNELEIDARTLPFNTLITATKKAIIPYWKSGALARFEVARVQALLLTLNLTPTKVLPAGAEVTIDGNDNELIPVGYQGKVFISTVSHRSISGAARWLDKVCYFHYHFSDSKQLIKDSTLCSIARS